MNKYSNKGLSGLQNLGNTCFINSSIQCLFNIYELIDIIENIDLEKKINNKPDSIMLLEWNKLRKMIYNDNCIISPGGFVTSVRKISRIKNKELFSGFSQNDLPEFLLFMIDCFHNSLSREVDMNINGKVINDKDKMAKISYEMMKNMYKKEFSEILTLFYGIHISVIVDDKNRILSRSPEPFLNISLPIPEFDKPTLYDCFNLYTEHESLSGDNAWYNESTGLKQHVTKKLIFWSLPKIMIIDLKRFNYINLEKNKKHVHFELENLDMRNYVNEYYSESYIYDLFAICNHVGSKECGHYFSYIRNANNKWYKYDDTDVNEIKDHSNLITSDAYCLFYRKKK